MAAIVTGDVNLSAFLHQCKVHEGVRLTAYRDSIGKLTIGTGHNIDDDGLTITLECNDWILAQDAAKVIAFVRRVWPWIVTLDDVRQRVVYDIAFNEGAHGLSKWVKFPACLVRGDVEGAATEILTSLAARKYPVRYGRLAAMMRSGVDLTAALLVG